MLVDICGGFFANDANVDIAPIEVGCRILNKTVGVLQYDLSGNLLKEYDSIIDASNEFGIFAQCIKAVCKKDGTAYTAGGYIWRFKDDPLQQEELLNIPSEKKRKPVIRIDVESGLADTFSSLLSVRKLGFSSKYIKECCDGLRNSYKGYKWKYAD